MADGSVGSVFLDLVVRDTVDKQVKAMAEKAQATTQKSFAGMEQAISAAVEKAVAKATKAATAAASSASRAATQAADAAQKAVQAAASSATSCGQQVENTIGQSFSKSVALAQSKVAQLEKAFDAVTYKLDGQWYSGAFDPASKATQKLLAEQEKLMAQLEAAQDRLAIEVQAAAQKRAAAEAAAAQKAAATDAAAKAKQEAAAQKAAAAAQKAAQQAAAAQEREARKNEVAQQKAAQAAAKAHEQSAARIKNAFSKAFSGAKKMAGGFGNAVAGIKNKFSAASKSANRFGTRLKSIISGALVFNLLSAALRKMTDYLGTAVSSSSQMKDALANLKGAAMTATQPILEILTPALTALANGAATVLSYLTRLISFFTGKTVTSMSNAAKKIQSTAGAAKKAMGSLAGFDEIQKLGSGDNGDSGGESESKAPNFDFRGQNSFLDSVMESVKTGNWGDVGALVAQKLNDSLASIKWPDIQAKVKSWVSGVAQTINGFVGTLDFSTVGSTISGGLNTILNGINTYFQDVDWASLGSGIGTSLSNMFSTLDWRGVGLFLTNGIRSLLESLHGFVTTFNFSAFGSNLAAATMSAINNVDWVRGAKDLGQAAIGLFKTLTAWITDMDWQQIGNTIADSVAAVDWNGLVSSLVEGIGAALAGLTELIWGLIEDAWASVVKWWKKVAYEDGQFTMEGLLKGIGDIFVNIGTWIKENIFDPFINGFKNAFDIHSPSGEMESMGVFLIQGLFQGISNTWTTITTFFTDAFESVKKTMVDIWENGIVPAIKDPINSIIGFINGLISGVCDGINTIIKAMNKLKWDVPDWVPVLGGKTFGFKLKTITAPQIPMLANGGVITQPTLAMMGEYPGAKSNPEIAAPKSLLQETMVEVLGDLGDTIAAAIISALRELGLDVNIYFTGDLAQLARVLKPVIDSETRRKGGSLASGGTY